MQTIGKFLILFAVALAIAGALMWLVGRLGVGALPGDFRIQREGFSCFVPIMSSILLSIILTVVLNLLLRWFR